LQTRGEETPDYKSGLAGKEGAADRAENVLKLAPHTARVVLADDWSRPYSREKAAFPLPALRFNKFWPSVSRVDSAYGDRNLICACIPVEECMRRWKGRAAESLTLFLCTP